MTSRTSGGLVKRSFTITQEQNERLQAAAASRGVSEAAVLREWLDWGYLVDQRRRGIMGQFDDLAMDAIAAQRDIPPAA